MGASQTDLHTDGRVAIKAHGTSTGLCLLSAYIIIIITNITVINILSVIPSIPIVPIIPIIPIITFLTFLTSATIISDLIAEVVAVGALEGLPKGKQTGLSNICQEQC